MNIQEGTQINPIDYLKIFFRRKWLLIIPTIIGMVGGTIAGNLMPKVYEAYTLILVEEEKIINPIISGLAVSTSAAQRLNTLREQILGWYSLVKLTEKLNLAKDVKNQKEFENLILNRLRKNIFVQLRGNNLIRIAFRGEDPDLTQQTVKTITDIFIEQNIESQNKESDVAIAFLTEQLKIYQKKIKESEIASMEDQLKTLLIDSTEQHPLVKDLRAKLASAREELAKEDFQPDYKVASNLMYEKLKLDLQKEIQSLENNMAQTAPSMSPQESQTDTSSLSENIYKAVLIDKIDKIDSVLARDVRVNEIIYNMLLQKLETAKITQRLEASKEGTRYTVLDPPRLPLRPIQPNKALVFMLGAVIGLAAGFGLVLLIEFTDTSFLGVDEAKSFLKSPILGAISKIITAEDIARIKAKRTAAIGVSVIASVSAIFIVIIYSLVHK